MTGLAGGSPGTRWTAGRTSRSSTLRPRLSRPRWGRACISPSSKPAVVRRASARSRIVLTFPEDPALVVFKEGIGFPVVKVPSKAWLLPVADTLVRWRKPFLHYRLTGRMSPRADRGRTRSDLLSVRDSMSPVRVTGRCRPAKRAGVEGRPPLSLSGWYRSPGGSRLDRLQARLDGPPVDGENSRCPPPAGPEILPVPRARDPVVTFRQYDGCRKQGHVTQ